MEFDNVRGFTVIAHRNYPKTETLSRLLQESSVIGDYKDSLAKPGSSYLWVSENFHLNREEIQELAGYLILWLNHGNLKGNPLLEGDK